ncbi:MAG: hypothetical protein AB1664_24170 [Thermodesulfobacteriota bacterium]
MARGNLHHTVAFLFAVGLTAAFPAPILGEEIAAQGVPYVVQRAQLD